MHKTPRLIIVLTIVALLTGCGDQRILEKLGFTQTTSYDLASDHDGNAEDKLLISVSIPRSESDSGDTEREFLTAIAPTSKAGKINLARQTELILVSGQLRNAIFGLSLAKEGIWEHIDTLVRDPSISPQVKITVVNGSAHDLLKKDYPQHPRTGQYIDRMLETESLVQTVPKISVYQFTKDYFDDGIDPVAPMIKEMNKNIVIDGIALFRKDRYIMKIEPDHALIFAFLRGKFKQGEISINLSEVGRNNEYVMFSSLVSKRSIKATSISGENRFRVDIHIKITGSVLEYIGALNLDNEKDRNKIEALISDYITTKAEDMIATMQQHSVDSLGTGRYVRSTLKYKQWKSMDWHQVFQNIEVKCHVNVRIKDFGIFVK